MLPRVTWVGAFNRRRFVAGAGATALAAAGAGAASRRSRAARADVSQLQHIVVVTMENRSFDHLLGWLPGANGKQAGLAYPDRSGALRHTYHLTDFQGCTFSDPDHSYEGGRAEFDDGRCDGWLQAGANDEFAIGYYTAADLPFLGPAARAWTVCDQWFAPILGPTYPNRFYLHSGTTDRIVNTMTQSTLPTIWDRLSAAGIDGRYYFGDVPFVALWGAKYVPIARTFAQFVLDCATGALPAVAYLDPRFLGEDQGVSNDDHPHADIRVGESFLNDVYRAVTTSPAWPSTLLVITFDEWGGFFDHVRPGLAPDVQPAFHRRGFRVPTILISPFAPRGAVSHTLFDHTSILRLIESRFGLTPLAVRDAKAANLASALDLSRPRLVAPVFDVPAGVGFPCPPASATGESEWRELAELARDYGYPA